MRLLPPGSAEVRALLFVKEAFKAVCFTAQMAGRGWSVYLMAYTFD